MINGVFVTKEKKQHKFLAQNDESNDSEANSAPRLGLGVST